MDGLSSWRAEDSLDGGWGGPRVEMEEDIAGEFEKNRVEEGKGGLVSRREVQRGRSRRVVFMMMPRETCRYII